uniref:Secreted RxLR effector peptide protein n=1 Tax=Panagrellus redivivus TaxID=6233 RepID=A0A7E4V0C4_PANRE
MQPRTLYTLLLMLVIIGSALGHGRHIKQKRSPGFDSPDEVRASMMEGFHRLKILTHTLDNDHDVDIVKKLVAKFVPDASAYDANWRLSLKERFDLIRGYIALVPVKGLMELKRNYQILEDDLWQYMGFMI